MVGFLVRPSKFRLLCLFLTVLVSSSWSGESRWVDPILSSMPEVCRKLLQDSRGEILKLDKDSNQSAIEILEPPEGFVIKPGQTFTLRVAPPSSALLCLVMVLFGKLFETEGGGIGTSTAVKVIAPEEVGSYPLRVFTFDTAGRSFFAERTIHVETPVRVREIQVNESLASKVGPVEEYRFELGRPLFQVVLPRLLPHIKLLDVQSWPHKIQDQYYESRRFRVPFVWRDSEYFFGNFNSVTVRPRLVRVGTQSFYFISKLTRSEMGKRDGRGRYVDPDRTFHTLAYVSTGSKVTEDTVLESVEGNSYNGMPLMFDVQSYGHQVLLVYASKGAIFQLHGKVVGDRIDFNAPRPYRKLTDEVYDLQLSVSSNKVHLLWSEKSGSRALEGKLYYMNAEKPEVKWGDPHVISETANRGTANMAVDNNKVYIAWADHLYRRRKRDHYINYDKIFITKSEDEGNSFLSPTIVSSKTDENDKALKVYLTLSGEDPVLLWFDDWRQRSQDDWKQGILSSPITVFQRLNDVPFEELQAAYARRMSTVYSRK